VRKKLTEIEEKLKRYAVFRFLLRYAELIRYGIVGVMTTGVNLLIYLLCTRLLFSSLFSADPKLYATVFNAVAWCGAVLFAFFANRSFVFGSREEGGRLLFQFGSFVALRVASGAVEILAPSLLIRYAAMHDLLAKIAVSVAVIVINYLFSKFVTFARRSENREV
jgi:putative flippase GtrA